MSIISPISYTPGMLGGLIMDRWYALNSYYFLLSELYSNAGYLKSNEKSPTGTSYTKEAHGYGIKGE